MLAVSTVTPWAMETVEPAAASLTVKVPMAPFWRTVLVFLLMVIAVILPVPWLMTALFWTSTLSKVPVSFTVLLARPVPLSVTFSKPSPEREDSARVTPAFTTVCFTSALPVV